MHPIRSWLPYTPQGKKCTQANVDSLTECTAGGRVNVMSVYSFYKPDV